LNIIFFHIPRTAGSSIWHSLANSFNEIESLGILDTYNESFIRYACFNHEEEILKEFLELDGKANFLIHVHNKIKFSDLNYVDLVVFGKRNLFTWRTSFISHNFKNELSLVYIKIKKQIACRHPQMCLKKNQYHLYFWKLFYVMTESMSEWNLCVIPKNNLPKYDILTYNEDINSQIELGNKLQKIFFNGNDSSKFKLERYGSTNSDLKIRGSHDTIGVQRFLGNLINILTFPMFLFFHFVRGLKQEFKSLWSKSPSLERLQQRFTFKH